LAAAIEASAALCRGGFRFSEKSQENSWSLRIVTGGRDVRPPDSQDGCATKEATRFGIAKRFSGVTRCAVMADLIKTADLKNRMKKIPEWELEKNHIERTFEFDDFADAIDFVNAVAEVAEEEEHHPDIDIRYNKVRLVVSTHSKGGLTELDFGLAERIDTLAE
jgi:4a-hydroxytetrahydrobiopterin dehydratase